MQSLPEKIITKLCSFKEKESIEIEKIRTYLFVIKHICDDKEGLPDNDDLVRIQSYFTDNIHSSIKSLLWQYMSIYQYESEYSGNTINGLVINSDFLSMFFALKLLDSSALNDYLTKKIHGMEASFSFFGHLSSYLSYIVHLIRTHSMPAWKIYSDDRPESFLKAKLFLLAEYAHGDLDLQREIRICDELDGIFSTEAILYTVKDSYREHLQHTIDCFLTGLFLLEVQFADGKSFIEKIAPSYNTTHMLLKWIIAGLLHDVGYIIDLCDHAVTHISCLRHAPETKSYIEKVKLFLREANSGLLEDLRPKIKTMKKMEKIDHGVISAVHVFYMFKNSFVEPSPLIDDSIKAIVKHNLNGEVIDPKVEPLSFLLLLCDHLQEWDRPRVDSILFRKEVYQRLASPFTLNFSNSTLLKYMHTNIRIKTQSHTFTTKDRLYFSLVYKDSSEESFEPVVNWVSACYDFQKLKSASLEVPVNMCLIHPPSKELKQFDAAFSELDLFQYFTRNCLEAAMLSTWCNNVKFNTCPELKYSVDSDGTESLLFHLQEFSANRMIIRKMPSNLFSNYRSWKEEHLKKSRLRKSRI